MTDSTDFGVMVRRGKWSGISALNKYGLALDCDNGVKTDIWDGADGATSTDVWVAPTAARIHAIVSGSADDDIDSGTGMRKVKVYGLTSWTATETSEDVELQGLTPVNTVNSYVIIHRMKGTEFGSGGTNAGIIKATAATDSTVTAAVQTGEGQTQMAIYGVPSNVTFHLKRLYSTILRATGAGAVKGDLKVLVKENADTATAGFVTKLTLQVSNAYALDRQYDVPPTYTGPCIIKLQVNVDTDNSDVGGSFDGYLVTE